MILFVVCDMLKIYERRQDNQFFWIDAFDQDIGSDGADDVFTIRCTVLHMVDNPVSKWYKHVVVLEPVMASNNEERSLRDIGMRGASVRFDPSKVFQCSYLISYYRYHTPDLPTPIYVITPPLRGWNDVNESDIID